MSSGVITHSRVARLAHWMMAAAILIMIGSGWRIYDNVPILPFQFPYWITLGGSRALATVTSNDWGTANAIAWHFAGMWLLLAGFCLLVGNGLLRGHFRRHWLPLGPRAFLHDVIAALTFRLEHQLGEYNAVQRALYWGVLGCIAMMFVTGLALYKPVQLGWLTWLFGGFPATRVVHFIFMALIVGFLVVHLSLVALFPATLRAMVLGRAGHAAPVREEGAADA